MEVNFFTYVGIFTTAYWFVYVFCDWLNGETKKK